MRYERPHFRIDSTDFLKGGNTFENYTDGGIGFNYTGYNPFAKPGWLAGAPSSGSTVDATLVKNPGISWGIGKGAISQTIMSVGINSSNDGYFYNVTPSTGAFTLVGSADTTQTYQQGFTDTVFYKGSYFTTSKTDIVKNSYDLATRDVSFWQTTRSHPSLNSYALHPQVVFGDIHYIADGQYLHQNDNGTTQVQVLDLGSDYVITALTVYNNLIYIAAEPYYNFSGTAHGGSKIFTWNGYADSFLDEYDVDLRVTAMRVWRSILYVWTYGAYMGYFVDGTVKPLYPVTTPVYPSQITTTRDSLWFTDGYVAIRYGSPFLRGTHRFNRTYNENPNVINGIIGNYQNGMIIASTGTTYGSNKFVSDVNAAGGCTVAFNARTFPQPVKVRGYVINCSQIESGKTVQVSYIDETGTEKGQKAMNFSTTPYEFSRRFDVFGEKAQTRIIPYLYLDGGAYLKSVDVLYEPSEWKINE